MSVTPEQVKEFLQSAEAKAAIEAAVDEAVKSLKSKNQELLGKIHEMKDKVKTLEAEKDEAETKAAEKSGDVNKVREQIENKFKKEIETRDSTIAKLSGQLETHVIGEGLTQALVKAKVSPALMDAAKALIKLNYKGEVGDNDGKPFAKFDGKAVDEFVTAWAQSDAGKHFVSADNNSGGGSNGANGNGKANAANSTKRTMTRAEFDAIPLAEQPKIAREVNLVD